MGQHTSTKKYQKVDLVKVKKQFADENGDGLIQPNEMENLLKKTLGITDKEAKDCTKDLFKEFDKDKDGNIDFREFCANEKIMAKYFTDE